MDDIGKQILKLRKQLIIARIMYYCYNSPRMPDITYDRLEHKLRDLEDDYPEIAKATKYNDCTPTKNVGSDNFNDYNLGLVRIAQGILSVNIKEYEG